MTPSSTFRTLDRVTPVWYTGVMNTKQQGDLGVAAAIFEYTRAGYVVSIPATDNARYDLLVDNGTISKVQCKTTRYKNGYGIYMVQLATSGGNRSGEGSRKCISEDECDLVFVYCMDGTKYEFPAEFVSGKANMNLGKLCEQYKL